MGRVSVVAVTPIFHEKDLLRARLIEDADFVEVRIAYASSLKDLDFKWLLPSRDKIIVSLKGLEKSEWIRSLDKEAERVLTSAKRMRLMIEICAELLEKLGWAEDFLDNRTVVSLCRAYDESSLRKLVEKYSRSAYVVKVCFSAEDRKFLLTSAVALSIADNVAIDLEKGREKDIALLALMNSKMLYGYADYKMEYNLSYKTVKLIVSKLEELLSSLSRNRYFSL
ncbi:MAG: hypothetical protein QW065_01500 [Acidilobaceae archaeon]